MEIKNWKEYPKVQEVKEKFENEKVRSSMRWVFQIMVTLVFAAVVGDHDVSDSYDAGKLHGTDDFCRRPFFYK